MSNWSLNLSLNKSFWKQDGFVGALVALVFLLGAESNLMQSLERKFYDVAVRMSAHEPSDKIAVITIDDNSIANLGHWPWSRTVHAKMIEILNSGHPQLIGYSVLFPEPQRDEGLSYISRIAEYVSSPRFQDAMRGNHAAELAQLNMLLRNATQNLEHDQKLSDSLAQANNTLLGMSLEWGDSQGKPKELLPDYISRNSLINVPNADALTKKPHSAAKILPPIALLGSAAMGEGHSGILYDIDDVVRTDPLVVRYYDQYYPSLSLMLAAKSLNLDMKDIQIKLGEGVQLGNRKIATDPELQMHTYFYPNRDGKPAFQEDSFYDVYTGKISPEKYHDKIVLIGAAGTGLSADYLTPISTLSPVVLLAHSLSSILKGDYFVIPSWGKWVENGVFLAIMAYLIFGLPRLKAAVGAVTTTLILIGLLLTHFTLMETQGIWLKLMLPAMLLLVGHLFLTTKHFLLTEKGKQKSDADSAESNRMLGLAFQGQGQLDLAFDKFRKVPMNDGLMEVLYNLGLDFERKRQFNKAELVFKYMAEYDPNFRDLRMRLSQAKTIWDTFMFGGGANARIRNNPNSLVLDGLSKPMLGRYEIEKELGKGTMGVVYRGRDTKIGRIVAIKTMTFSHDFEAEELKEVTMRFFREAETAGRLSHPNIVAIYDVGEEHDLSYIAMEFLNGDNLEQYTQADNLLPLKTVVNLVAHVADALDYAHKQNVVHRDIKPANIMYNPETDSAKVTDFGIARITNSSQTKTGMVFGTPSYMSPEQLAGKKIEGGSDLFSLGITLYQLACGKLPFEGESMAQLMYAIANQPHADITSLRPDIPPCLVSIIDKALAKKQEERYANGAQMAAALRLCAAGTWMGKQ